MSPNTQCPTCSAVFVATSETLAAAGGWVRCGRCANIFDASAHHPVDTAKLDNAMTVSHQDASTHLSTKTPQTSVESRPVAHATARFDPQTASRRLKRVLAKLSRSIEYVMQGVPDGKEPSTTGSGTLSQKQQRIKISMDAPPIKRHLPTWLLGCGAGLLSLLLLSQIALAYRAELLTHYPSLQPAFQTVCANIGCRINAVKALELIAIDNTSFTSLGPAGSTHRFQLSWDIRNQALHPVMAPALELSLNDALDRPVVRKVLLPSQLGLPAATLAPVTVWADQLQIDVSEVPGASVITGYRLRAFYP